MSVTTAALRASTFALFATFAFAATEPALAAPAKAATASSAASKPGAAHRHHHAQQNSVRNAYGAYDGGMSAGPARTWNNYGYGNGDNSRNQTW